MIVWTGKRAPYGGCNGAGATALACLLVCQSITMGQAVSRATGPVSKQAWKQIAAQTPRTDVEQSVDNERSGYLPILGPEGIAVDYSYEAFDRSRLISLNDIIIPGLPEPGESEEKNEAEADSTGREATDADNLALTVLPEAPAPVSENQTQPPSPGQTESQTLSSPYLLANPLPDPSLFMHYFEAPLEPGAPVLNLPFLLPYQSPPLIMEGNARYRIVPAAADAESAQ